jgi:hypothetical protein
MPTNNHFQITFPSSWCETSIYSFQGPHDSGIQHNLVLTIDSNVPKNTDLILWAKQQFGTSKESLPGFELINEKEITLTSGIAAYEIVCRYCPSDARALFQKQVFIIIEEKGYIFTATFSKKTLKTIANEVDEIIASIMPLEIGDDSEQ